MFANMVMSKKLTRHARVVFAIVCISLPQLGFTACNTAWNSSCPQARRFCNQCVSDGSNCATSINAARLDCLADTNAMLPVPNTNYYLYFELFSTDNPGCNALRNHLCSFKTATYQNATVIIPDEIDCAASGDFNGAKIHIKFNNNGPVSASNTNYTYNGQRYIPYFNEECKVTVSQGITAHCYQFDSNLSSFTFNGLTFDSNYQRTVTWNYNDARWSNISNCGGWFYGPTTLYDDAHCANNYTEPAINTTSDYDTSGKNQIWYARADILSHWKIRYTQTGSICTICNACQTGYTLAYDTPGCPTNAAICTVYTPDCPDGFTPSNLPPQCNVDSNISYTDETGIFTLANGSYEADTTGYTSNTTCDLQN